MPTYEGTSGYNGSILKFKLGDLYDDELAFIDSLAYTFSDTTPWDINADGKLGELPMGMDIAITLTILGKEQPQMGTGNDEYKVYGY
jgi:hypothetical protein